MRRRAPIVLARRLLTGWIHWTEKNPVEAPFSIVASLPPYEHVVVQCVRGLTVGTAKDVFGLGDLIHNIAAGEDLDGPSVDLDLHTRVEGTSHFFDQARAI